MIGLAAVAVGAWAAYGFFSTGAQPAEALPADTLGYASVDLDPSGGQKIEALRTLNKFPAFEDEVGIDGDDDLRKSLFDKIQEESPCDGLDYADDIEPWLGDRAAIAAVADGDEVNPVIVLQVKDAGEAEKGLGAIKDCSEDDDLGWAVEGDWAVLAETDGIADDVVAASEKGTLADDEDFQKWTSEAGSAGIMTMYAGPAAGDYIAEHGDDMFGFGGMVDSYACDLGGGLEGFGSDDGTGGFDDGFDDETGGGYDDGCATPSGGGGSEATDELQERFRDFGGMAVTVRFADGAVELEAAGDASISEVTGMVWNGGGADVVATLPSDTAAVLGLGFADGWFGDLVEGIAPQMGMGSAEEVMDELSELSGLDLPEDAETLAGDSLALAVGSDIDAEALMNSEDGSDLPIAVKVQGDPDAIEGVLDKLREMAGPGAAVLEADADGDVIAIGPNPDYRAEVLKDGGLGDESVFKDAVRESDQAQSVLFVNVNDLEAAIEDLAEGEDEVLENIEPIAAFGASGWIEDDVAHSVIRVTTD